MELSERKKKILRAIVDNYVRTAEPVGSKTIAAMPGMDFSPATIRNEMAELTTMGLLEQPHTSAGRVPSPAGYRLYVDELMQDYRLTTDETKSINQAMEAKLQQFDQAISQVGKLVSKMTNLPAYAMAAAQGSVTVKRFDLILENGLQTKRHMISMVTVQRYALSACSMPSTKRAGAGIAGHGVRARFSWTSL